MAVGERKEGIDVAECLRRGAIGAAGAVPGTLAAHPLDLLKMHRQVHGGRGVAEAVAAVQTGGSLYRGVGAGVLQKCATRGPMFLASEVGTQGVERALGWSRDRALFLGSALSGYATGAVASGFEWAKVQRGVGAASGPPTAVSRSRALAVVHGAGVRNACFDATFFGSEHAARERLGLPPALSYGAAAALAVTVDFPVDVAVKRLMAGAVGDAPAGGGLAGAVAALLRRQRWAVFAGLGFKGAEFFISYAVTGASAGHVRALFEFPADR